MDQAPPLPGWLEALRPVIRRVPGGMPLGRLGRRLIDPELREIERLRRAEAARLLQPFPDTAEERYPALFDALARRLAPLPGARILCFGCSGGAEVRALARRLPRAAITGIDLNRRRIAAARKADPEGDYRVGAAPPADMRFDAVLAMAVFRHGDLAARRPESCTAVLPFARFAAALGALDACLEPGGWLALGNAHFRLADTALAASYRAEPDPPAPLADEGLFYGPDDARIEAADTPPLLYRKAQ